MAQNRDQLVLRMIFMVIAVQVVLGFWHVESGLINGDEGWYLHAARQISLGMEPYRDFAFFQPPLYPRVLASWIEPGPGSILAARWFSWLLLMLATGLTSLAALRFFGLTGALISTIVMTVNPLVSGTAVLAKPYALAMFLIAGGLFLLAARDRTRVFLGFMLLGLAVGVRISVVAPLVVLVLSRRGSVLVSAILGSTLGLSLAFAASIGVGADVLWENWIGFHIGDGGSWSGRLKWTVWQLGFSGFFLIGFVVPGTRRLTGLHWAALTGLVVHSLPTALHVEHTVVMMPFIALAVAERWGHDLRPWTAALGAALLAVSVAVGMRWTHTDQTSSTVKQTMEIGRWVAEHSNGEKPLLTTQLTIAVEADRGVCSGFEMGNFGWSPEMDERRVKSLHRLSPAVVDRCLNGTLGGIVLSSRDFNNDIRNQIMGHGRAAFSRHRSVDGYGQFSSRLDIFVAEEGVLWTE